MFRIRRTGCIDKNDKRRVWCCFLRWQRIRFRWHGEFMMERWGNGDKS